MKSLLFILILISFSPCRANIPAPKGKNIIFITFDGVRYQDFFNKDIFSKFWKKYARKGIVLGDPNKDSRVRISNFVSLSLPAYRTIHTGRRTFCKTNNCKHTKRETFSESIKRRLKLARTKVAVISSWDGICRDALQKRSSVLNSCGFKAFNLPGHEEINQRSFANPPLWKNARLDKYTWEHGLKFIKENQPRLVTIALDDSDEYGHDKKWDEYIHTLKVYDQKIDELFTLLNTMEKYAKETLIFITTDHGRGKKKKWHGHSFMRSARSIWMFLAGPGIPKKGSISHRKAYSHLDIRPFFESYLGLSNEN